MENLLFNNNTSLDVTSDESGMESVLTQLVAEITHYDTITGSSWLTMTMTAKIVSKLIDREGLMSISNRELVCFLRREGLLEDEKSYAKLNATIEGKKSHYFSLDAGHKKTIGFSVEGLHSFYEVRGHSLREFVSDLQQEKETVRLQYLEDKRLYRAGIDFYVSQGLSITEAKTKNVKPEKVEVNMCS